MNASLKMARQEHSSIKVLKQFIKKRHLGRLQTIFIEKKESGSYCFVQGIHHKQWTKFLKYNLGSIKKEKNHNSYT